MAEWKWKRERESFFRERRKSFRSYSPATDGDQQENKKTVAGGEKVAKKKIWRSGWDWVLKERLSRDKETMFKENKILKF